MERPDATPEAVLVCAPRGRTAGVVQSALEAAGLACTACDDAEALAERVREGAGAVVVLAEALREQTAADCLAGALRNQEPWSALPVIVCASGPALAVDWRASLGRTGRCVMVIERPVGRAALVSAVEVALDDRRRQYALRDALHALDDANSDLETRVGTRTREVRRLAAALSKAELAERARVAQLLHDDVQQLLYGAKMQVEVGRATDNPDLLLRAEAALEDASHAVRSLAADLDSDAEDDLGAALASLAETFERRYGLRVDVEASCESDLDGTRQILFRAVRELLFNVVKHAEADHARVRLRQVGPWCEAEVSDDGVGFDPGALTGGSGTGLGLKAMTERFRQAGGEAEIEAGVGSGTRVTLRVPRA